VNRRETKAGCHRRLAQDRANRSKKSKVIYRQINMFEQTQLLPAWDDIPRSVRIPGSAEFVCAHVDGAAASAETRHIETSTKRDLMEIADGFQL
jgi:hypothetical protein